MVGKSFQDFQTTNVNELFPFSKLCDGQGTVICKKHDFIVHIDEDPTTLDILQNHSKFEVTYSKTPITKGELIMLNDKRGILNSPLNNKMVEATSSAFNHLLIIYLLAIKQSKKNIALTVNPILNTKLFEIKSILVYLFWNSEICVTLYSASIVTLNSENEIREVLGSYHLTPLGGH